MFKEDTKNFTENLGTKHIEAKEPPSMAEAETYWKSLQGEEAQHNGRAEWIRRNRKVKLVTWVECLYRLQKLLHICLKLTVGNLLEVIKYKITSLKLSQLLKGILLKTSMQE